MNCLKRLNEGTNMSIGALRAVMQCGFVSATKTNKCLHSTGVVLEVGQYLTRILPKLFV